MALDRQSIEKKDFPVGRRGYEPAAVDAHLTAISDEVEELKRSARKRSESLASGASEQVRAIIDAAETQRGGDPPAGRGRRPRDPRRCKQCREVGTRSRGHRGARVHRQGRRRDERPARADRRDGERAGFCVRVAEGGRRQDRRRPAPAGRKSRRGPRSGRARALRARAGGAGRRPGRGRGRAIDPRSTTRPSCTASTPVSWPRRRPPPTPRRRRADAPVHRDPAGGAGEDVEGARLIALNMALDGTTREETDRYLAENFKLSDRAALLDEVYESVHG